MIIIASSKNLSPRIRSIEIAVIVDDETVNPSLGDVSAAVRAT